MVASVPGGGGVGVGGSMAGGGGLASSAAAQGHGTFGHGKQVQRRDGGNMRAALALAGATLLVSAACFMVIAWGGAPPSVLASSASYDDVAHDDAVATISGTRHLHSGGKRLNAHSSIADFFNAAMNGEFDKGSGVEDATSGLITGRVRPGMKAKATYQSLAAHRLHAKKSVQPRDMHTAESEPRRAMTVSEESEEHGNSRTHRSSIRHSHHTAGSITKAATTRGPSHMSKVAHSGHGATVAATAARQQALAAHPGGGLVLRHTRGRRVQGVSERKWKFPTEDKFVARYTGGIPQGDVLVDSFTAGPYVPL